MHVLDHRRLTAAALPGIHHTTLAGSAQGLQRLSVWRQSIAAGGSTPPHRHDCEEVVIVEAGRGQLLIDGSAQAFAADMTLVIPPNVVHQIINIGDESLRLTAAFSTSPVAVYLADGQALPLPWAS